MSAPEACPKCGTELPPDAPAGLCPKCLVAAGLRSEMRSAGDLPNSSPEAPTVDSPSPGTGFQPPSPAQLADKFPQFEILELLGHGGMGAVYQARQKNLDRLVALKIIRPEATHDPAFAERFNREARTLARLSHPHIVGVHDFGEVVFSASEVQPAQPLYYFVMEYVDGANLRQLMQSGELAPEQALAIVPQICDALQYAHDEGIVHRDIKPENILLDKRGRVKIADFGLAKLTTRSEAEFTLTGTHQIMGTLRYMAPEQLEGSHAVDHRADIYSLGVVFYEMLTGEAPMGHFEPPSRKVEVDARLDEVVLRSLAREPERRYQHASNVKTDVESISNSAHPTPAAATVSVASDGSDRVGRQMEAPAALLMIAGVALCLAGAILLVLYLGRQIVEDALLVFGIAAGLFVVGGALVVAGVQLRRLQGYGTGLAVGFLLLPVSTVVPAIFSQSNSPWMFAPLVLLLPVALWLLWLLSRPEVKQAFEQQRLQVGSGVHSRAGEFERRYPHASDVATALRADFDTTLQYVQRPAIGLMLVGALSVLSQIITGTAIGLWIADHLNDASLSIPIVTIATPVIGLLGINILLSLLIAFGAWHMMHLTSLRWANAASALALLPLPAGPFWILSLPISIWAFVVLSKPNVREAFQQAAPPSKSPTEQLLWPSRLLVGAGVINLGQVLLCIGQFLYDIPPSETRWQILGIFIITPLVLGGLQIVSGLQMKRLAAFELVVITSFLSLLPVSGGAVAGIPAGIWALAMLFNANVRHTFALRQ